MTESNLMSGILGATSYSSLMK